jgi:hypothetical protein
LRGVDSASGLYNARDIIFFFVARFTPRPPPVLKQVLPGALFQLGAQGFLDPLIDAFAWGEGPFDLREQVFR